MARYGYQFESFETPQDADQTSQLAMHLTQKYGSLGYYLTSINVVGDGNGLLFAFQKTFPDAAPEALFTGGKGDPAALTPPAAAAATAAPARKPRKRGK